MSKFAVALACTLAFVTGATTAAELTPIEHFAELPFLERPLLSPDGNSIAATVNADGQQTLVIYSLDPNNKSFHKISAGDGDINWWRWVNDDWLVAGIGQVQYANDTKIYVSRLIRISSNGKIVKVVGSPKGQDGDNLLWAARDGSPKILYSYQDSIYSEKNFFPRVSKFDVATGSQITVADPIENVFN